MSTSEEAKAEGEEQHTTDQYAVISSEPLSTLAEPLPLPPYEFDTTLSEDENFLTWVSILARHSSSRKGHMGTIFVRPPETGDPADEASGSASCLPSVHDRIIHYANNTPLLYSRQQKGVPEVHAEALVISRCARRGIALDGCTVYISFPPCNECFKLLLSAGVKRCVFKKAIHNKDAQGEAALVAAQVYGVSLHGTLDNVSVCQANGDEQGVARERTLERQKEDRRDQRVRAFWAGLGEDAQKTRARVARWWDDYSSRYRSAQKVIKARYGANGVEQQEQRKEAERTARKAARREAHEEGAARNEKKAEAKGKEAQGTDEDDLDELMNHGDSHGALKRPSEDTEQGSAAATKHTRIET